MEHMNIESAQYGLDMDGNNNTIIAVIDGVTMSVPLNPDNRHYVEIMKQVEAGAMTIAEADE